MAPPGVGPGGALSHESSPMRNTMPPNAEPASSNSDSGGESSVLVPECELNAGMWRKEGGKQPQERMQFDKAGKGQRLGERTGLSPRAELSCTL